MIRKTLFWLHLVLGLAAGVVVLVLCLTGAVLAFEKQIVDRAERDARARPPTPASELLSPVELLAAAAKVEPGAAGSITWSADPLLPVRLRCGSQSWVLLNGYTGEVLGRGAVALRAFFRTTTTVHTSLLLKATGSQIVDTGNVSLLVLLFSGFYLWWPRQWRWKALRNSIAFRLDAQGKVRDWNWHNALGFWSLPPLLFMAASGLVLSYGAVDKNWRIFAAAHLLAAPLSAPSPVAVPAPATPASWPALLRAVQRSSPGWRTITLNNPTHFATQTAVVFNVNLGQPGQRLQSSTVTFDKASASLLKSSGWAEIDSGSRARAVARLGHTGEIFGPWGQAIALAGCLAGGLLVYTGGALSWRRFFVRGRRVRPLSIPSGARSGP